MKKLALLTAGALAGGALTLSLQAFADKEASSPLPLNELRRPPAAQTQTPSQSGGNR